MFRQNALLSPESYRTCRFWSLTWLSLGKPSFAALHSGPAHTTLLNKTSRHTFPSQGLWLSPGDSLCKLELEWCQLNLIRAAFSSLLPSSLHEAVETQLACHCFSYALCPKIAHSVLPSMFCCW